MQELNSGAFDLVTAIFAKADSATLATLRKDGSPHASTVNFASDDMILYAAISIDGGKAHDLRGDGRIALTVNAPYVNWSEIQGMSIEGRAAFITDIQELKLASALLMEKLPGYAHIITEPEVVPWPGMLFIRITPERLTLLDYTLRFGHTESFDLRHKDADTSNA